MRPSGMHVARRLIRAIMASFDNRDIFFMEGAGSEYESVGQVGNLGEKAGELALCFTIKYALPWVFKI